MESFGKYLARKGVLSRKQLEEATQSLVIVGGRLGTNLVELGYFGFEELDRHLAEHLGVPCPPEEWLRPPRPEALEAVPDDLSRRHQILPLAVEKRTLHLAMLDPGDPNAVDEVAFATGLRIQPYVLSEVHLTFLRERHLGIAREPRFAHFAPEWARKRRRKARSSARRRAAPSAEQEEAQRQREALGVRPLEAEEELIDAATFSSLHSTWLMTHSAGGEDGGGPAPAEGGSAEPPAAASLADDAQPLAPAEAARLEEDLANAPDRETVSEHALRLARSHASAAALFVVHRGLIHGYRAVGQTIGERIEGVLLPLEAESVLAKPAAGKGVFRGPPPRSGIDERLFRVLGRSYVREAAIFPVRIRDRVVNLLYVDNGTDPLGETSIGALSALCDCISRAYEGLILARNRRHC